MYFNIVLRNKNFKFTFTKLSYKINFIYYKLILFLVYVRILTNILNLFYINLFYCLLSNVFIISRWKSHTYVNEISWLTIPSLTNETPLTNVVDDQTGF